MNVKTYGRLAGLQTALPAAEHGTLFAREGVSQEAMTAAWGPISQQLAEDPAALAGLEADPRAGAGPHRGRLSQRRGGPAASA